MLNIACINQDPGISPGRAKGAAVHLEAMRNAFAVRGASVSAFDLPDELQMREALASNHSQRAFDFIYERYALGKKAGTGFAHDLGVPRVLEVNAPLAEEAAKHRGVRETPADRDADNSNFREADLVIAVSGPVAEYAVRRGAREDRVMVCPNGIDTRRFHPGVSPASLADMGMPGDRFVVGFHGRERPWHGFDNLVRVVADITRKGLPIHLLVVGEGEFTGLAGLPADRYTRLGWQPHEDVPRYVASFHALPLTYEAGAPCYFSPLKLTEAMACGVVPLVPEMGDLARHVRHGETGLVYPAGDWEALESCIVSLAGDKRLHKRLAGQASAFAATQSWDRIAAAILHRLGLEAPRQDIAREG